MSSLAWIVLIGLFVALHLFTHRGHGAHAAQGSRPGNTGHEHGDDTAPSRTDDEAGRQSPGAAKDSHRGHGGC